MTDEDTKIPLWRKLLGVALLAAAVVGIVFGWHRVLSDAWPPDRSFVGPNLVASVVQWAIIFLVAALIWPPTRRRMHRFVDKKLAKVHEKIDANHLEAQLHRKRVAQHLQAAEQDREALHGKLDAIHAHLGIGKSTTIIAPLDLGPVKPPTRVAKSPAKKLAVKKTVAKKVAK